MLALRHDARCFFVSKNSLNLKACFRLSYSLMRSKVACRVTFQPSINRGQAYGTAVEVDDWKPEPSVFDRLMDNASKVMEKKQRQEQLSHRPFDPRTGRELFKPLIGRKPHNVRLLSFESPALFLP